MGTFGMPAGVCEAARRFGRFPLDRLVAPAARLAREGVPLNPQQAYIVEILGAIVTSTPRPRRCSRPTAGCCARASALRQPELGDALERLGAEGARPFYEGDIAAAIVDWLAERGGLVTKADLSAYEVVDREPVHVTLPGPRRAHQPAAVGRRHPHRPRSRPAGRGTGPSVGCPARRCDGEHPEGADPRVSRRAGRSRVPARVPGRPSRPAGLDDPHRALDRGRVGVLGDLLQRLGIRRHRPRHGCTPQQHARRAGPQPPRLSPSPARPADAEHDVPDHRPARRRRPAGRGQRRLQPDPLGGAADDHPLDRRRAARPRPRSTRRGCTSRTTWSTPSPGSTSPRSRPPAGR